MSAHLDRLDAMTAAGQWTWDLSPNDIAALKVARDALALVESAEGAVPMRTEPWVGTGTGGVFVTDLVVGGDLMISRVIGPDKDATIREARDNAAARLIATALKLRGAP